MATVPKEVSKSIINRTSGVNGGDACVRDTRIPVWTLIQLQKLGRTEVQLLDDFPSLTPSDIDAVWNYYRDHIAEIDAAIAAHKLLHQTAFQQDLAVNDGVKFDFGVERLNKSANAFDPEILLRLAGLTIGYRPNTGQEVTGGIGQIGFMIHLPSGQTGGKRWLNPKRTLAIKLGSITNKSLVSIPLPPVV